MDDGDGDSSADCCCRVERLFGFTTRKRVSSGSRQHENHADISAKVSAQGSPHPDSVQHAHGHPHVAAGSPVGGATTHRLPLMMLTAGSLLLLANVSFSPFTTSSWQPGHPSTSLGVAQVPHAAFLRYYCCRFGWAAGVAASGVSIGKATLSWRRLWMGRRLDSLSCASLNERKRR